jgi:hypothetical protein
MLLPALPDNGNQEGEEMLLEFGDALDAEGPAPLPPDYGPRMICCNHKCLQGLRLKYGTELEELQGSLNKMTLTERDNFLWDLVRASLNKEDSGRRQWRLMGVPVCRRAFKDLVGLGNKKMKRLCEALNKGMLRPFEDQRRHNGAAKMPDKYLDVDSFFNFLYHYVAEPLAEEDDHAPEIARENQDCDEYAGMDWQAKLVQWTSARDGASAAATSAMVGLIAGVGERRWLPHMSMRELFEWYRSNGPAEQQDNKARYTVFSKCWRETWSTMLKIREVGQHARCDTCARLSREAKSNTSEEKRRAAEVALRVHRQRNMADRAVDQRLTHLSELSTSVDSGGKQSMESRVLHVKVDGMDQAKFRCPRNMASSKGWASLWRPTLHRVGVLVEGVVEAFYITDADMMKDSNLELTALSMTLDRVSEILKERGLSMPEHLSLTYDNTAREGKNQHVAKWMAWLVASGKFRSVQDGNGQVGHTHNKLDQRFSVVAALLKRQGVLQTPEDFLTVIQQYVHPAGNRKLVVGKIEAAWNWQMWLEPLGLNLTGIAASQSVPDVGHSKRFVLRKDLPTLRLNLLPEWAEVVPPVFRSELQDPRDVIMLSKEFWSSDALAHPPLLIFPNAILPKLQALPEKQCLRNNLSPSQLAEFQKTAAKVEADPWRMEAAAAYLRKWCDQNVKQTFPMPDVLHFLRDQMEERRWERDSLAIADVEQQDDVWLRYAPGAPVAIAVHPAARKRSLTGGLGEPAVKKRKGKAKKADQLPADGAQLPAPSSHLGDAPRPPLPDGERVLDPSVPVRAPAVPQGLVMGESGARPGCSKCRYAKDGCKQCRRPNYKPRGPKRQAAGRDA